MDFIIDKLYDAGHFSGDWIYLNGCRMPGTTGQSGSVIAFRRKNMHDGMLLLGVPENQNLKHTLAPDQYIENGTKPFEERNFNNIPSDEIENLITNWFLGPEKHSPLCRTGDVNTINSKFISLKIQAASDRNLAQMEILNKFHF